MIYRFTQQTEDMLCCSVKALIDSQCIGKVWAIQLQQLGEVETREWLAYDEKKG